MRKLLTLLLLFPLLIFGQQGWLNEFHYDNAGLDKNEFVEVILPEGEDLSLYSVDFYNGRNGEIYKSVSLSNFTPEDTVDGFVIYYYLTSIQNGPDGIALVYNGSIIDDVAYEGLFDPMTNLSQAEETSSTEEWASIQLQGDEQEDYEWIDDEATPGYLNIDQGIDPLPIDSFYMQTCGQWGHKYNNALFSQEDIPSATFGPLMVAYQPCRTYYKKYTMKHMMVRYCLLCFHPDTITINDLAPLEYDSIILKQYPCDTASYLQWPHNYGIPQSIYENWPNEQWYIDYLNRH